MRKIILFLLLLISISIVSALVPTPQIWYRFENNNNDDGLWNSPFIKGDLCVYDSNSKEGSYSIYCPEYQLTSNYYFGSLRISSFSPFSINGTVCAWEKINTTTGDRTANMLGALNLGPDNGGTASATSNEIYIDKRDPAESISYSRTDDYNEWVHLCYAWNGTIASIYLNGTLVKNGTLGYSTYYLSTYVTINGFGNYSLGKSQANTYYDNWMYYNYTLSDSQILSIYNGEIPPTNFKITTVDSLTSSSINTFNATINGTLYQTTNGTIVSNLLFNSSFLWNISIFANKYANESFLNYNISDNLNVLMRYLVTPTITFINMTSDGGDIIPPYLTTNYTPTFNIITDINSSCRIGKENYNYSTMNSSRNCNVTGLTNHICTVKSFDSIALPIQNFYISCMIIGGEENETSTSGALETKFMSSLNQCKTTTNTTSLNITIYNENNVTETLISNVRIEGIFWSNSRDDAIEFHMDYINNYTYQICLYPSFGQVYADIYFQYEPSVYTGFTQRYYIFNGSFSNITQNFNLYNFKSITGLSELSITARNKQTYVYYPNIVAKLQRRYVDESLWRTIQMDKSGDFGELNFNIYERTQDYRLIFSDTNNNILETSNTLKFICNSGVCLLTWLISPISDIISNNITASIIYHNKTNTITAIWADPTASIDNVKFIVTKETATGSFTMCDNTTSDFFGTMNCNVAGYTGLFYVTIIANKNDQAIGLASQFIPTNAGKIGFIIGDEEGAFWTFGIVLTTAMFGIWSPVAVIIAAMFGLISCFFLGIYTPITITFIILACVIGLIIAFKVKS